MKLTIELIPSSSFFTNVRSLVSQEEWDIIRKKCYNKAKYRCQICFGKGPKWPVECHEIWHYDKDKKVQTLKGLIALCPACHEVKHFGLAQVRGRHLEALKHLKEVNQCTDAVAYGIVKRAFAKWKELSKIQWELNTDYLNNYLYE